MKKNFKKIKYNENKKIKGQTDSNILIHFFYQNDVGAECSPPERQKPEN